MEAAATNRGRQKSLKQKQSLVADEKHTAPLPREQQLSALIIYSNFQDIHIGTTYQPTLKQNPDMCVLDDFFGRARS